MKGRGNPLPRGRGGFLRSPRPGGRPRAPGGTGGTGGSSGRDSAGSSRTHRELRRPKRGPQNPHKPGGFPRIIPLTTHGSTIFQPQHVVFQQLQTLHIVFFGFGNSGQTDQNQNHSPRLRNLLILRKPASQAGWWEIRGGGLIVFLPKI